MKQNACFHSTIFLVGIRLHDSKIEVTILYSQSFIFQFFNSMTVSLGARFLVHMEIFVKLWTLHHILCNHSHSLSVYKLQFPLLGLTLQSLSQLFKPDNGFFWISHRMGMSITIIIDSLYQCHIYKTISHINLLKKNKFITMWGRGKRDKLPTQQFTPTNVFFALGPGSRPPNNMVLCPGLAWTSKQCVFLPYKTLKAWDLFGPWLLCENIIY